MPDSGFFQTRVGGDAMAMAHKEFKGELITVISVNFTTTGVKITRTPATGKTFYLIKASIIPITNTVVTRNGAAGISNTICTVDIKFDGAVIDAMGHDAEGSITSGAASAVAAWNHESQVVGKSMDGNASKKVEIEAITVAGTYRVRLIGFEVDTGVDPLL